MGLVAALIAAVQLSAIERPALAQPAASKRGAGAEARARLAAAQGAATAGDWVTALAEYQAANAAERSAAAQLGIAKAYDALGRLGEAHTAYTALLDQYARSILPAARKSAEARVKELLAKTTALTVVVSEPGASVMIDGALVGKSPLSGPLRVVAGQRKLRVTHDDFDPTERDLTLGAGASDSVQVTLKKKVTTGKLVVRSVGAGSARVLVDAAEVGDAPWEGELAPGSHRVEVKQGERVFAATVDLAAGDSKQLDLGAATARVEITTSDRLGEISIDGKPVGTGAFAGDVLVGKHKLTVTRDGFAPFEKEIEVTERHTLSETVTLKSAAKTTAGAVTAEDRADGIYGGINAAAVFLPFGTGIETEDRCSELGAASCEGPSSVGGAVFGYGGYAWDPLGLELMLAASYDNTTAKATFAGAGPGNPLAVGVAREEDFTVHRVGGLVGLRGRLSAQSTRIRGSLAAGFGLSYKVLVMTRQATAVSSKLADLFLPEDLSYLSPALTIEPSIALRLNPSTAIALGAIVWLETAGGDVRTEPDGQRVLAAKGAAVPIATPAYSVASGPQVFIGPYLGVQFGP